MTPRDLADLCERAPGFDAETLQEIADTLRSQADEIANLKAAAIVQGSIKLDEAVKTALERERMAAEIDELRSEAILRGIQVSNLMAEIQRLRAETGSLKAQAIIRAQQVKNLTEE
jgi:hypothetical protein